MGDSVRVCVSAMRIQCSAAVREFESARDGKQILVFKYVFFLVLPFACLKVRLPLMGLQTVDTS